MNITAIIKKNILMLVAIATVVGFSAFKIKQQFDPPQDGWYNLELQPGGNPANEAHWQITTRIGNTPGTGCSPSGSFERCAVELNFEPSATTVPSNMEEAYEDQGDDKLDVGEIAKREE